MSKETKVIVRDDLDGTEGATSYSFGLNGANYEIDLTESNFRKLEDFLKPYIDAGAKVTARLPRSGGSGSKSNKQELAAIRQWWRDQGNEINSRGRIPANIIEKYHESH